MAICTVAGAVSMGNKGSAGGGDGVWSGNGDEGIGESLGGDIVTWELHVCVRCVVGIAGAELIFCASCVLAWVAVV